MQEQMGKNKIHYAAESRRDLDEIWDYIAYNLQNVSAAERIVNRIMNDVDHLENHAEMGALLSSIVDDYEDEDVYKTVLEYKTVVRDIFEEKVEQIAKFSVTTALLQQGLIAKMRRNLGEGIEKALGYADEQVTAMKAQFSSLFDELDKIISEKYAELEECANDESEKQEHLKENQKLLAWIEDNMHEINTILDM